MTQEHKGKEQPARRPRKDKRSLLLSVSIIRALGWTIVLPLLLGIFAGRWLDRHFDTGIFWTLALLVAGLAIGCVLGWKRVYEADELGDHDSDL